MDHTDRIHWHLTTQPPYSDLPNEHGNDTYEWMHARIALWPLSHVPSTNVALAQNHDPMLRHGLWQAVIDLLMYGNGWVDFAGEMRAWRKSNYREENDVLSFIARNFSELLLPLETYFAVYHYANQEIAHYLTPNEDFAVVERLVESRPVENSNAIIRKCQKLNLDRSSAAFELVQILPDTVKRHDSSDPLHIAAHFKFEWSSAEIEIGPKDAISKVADDLGTVMFDSYGHWYRKAVALTNQWQDELMAKSTSADDLDYRMHIDVHIRGIGFLGRFARVGPGDRLCRVAPTDISHTVDRDVKKTLNPARSSAPVDYSCTTFGIPISAEMHEALVTSQSNPEWVGNAVKMEVLTREEVGLAFALVWHSPDVRRSWCLVDGEWAPGWITLEGKQAQECLLEMVKQKQLDTSIPLAEGMFDGSRCLDEIKPWAASRILDLWENVSRIPEIVAELAQMQELQELTQGNFSSDQLAQLQDLIDRAHSRRASDLSTFDHGDVFDVLRDPNFHTRVQYLLDNIITLLKR